MTAWADLVVVGGGCIGLNVASGLRRALPGIKVLLLEKEQRCGRHASSRNSGVIHAGLYYPSDTMKAKMTRDGNRALTRFISERNLALDRCGKLVVARSRHDLDQLDLLYKRGITNGVEVEMISAAEALEIDPVARTFERALWSPTTSVADPEEVTIAQIQDALDAGVVIESGRKFTNVFRSGSRLRVLTSDSESIETGHLVNAAGLYADQIAHLCQIGLQYAIVPFRGMFLRCPSSVQIRTNIYPIPDLRQPFLGVHWTVGTAGHAPKIGPTSMPALSREHYTGGPDPVESISILKQLMRMLWHDRDGIRGLARNEFRKWSKYGLCAAASELVSLNVPISDLSRSSEWLRPGIRAQLVHNAELVNDFVVEGDDRSTHILNAVSPAWTCSIPIADHVIHHHVVPKLNAR